MIRRPPRSTLFPYTDALPIYAVACPRERGGSVEGETPEGQTLTEGLNMRIVTPSEVATQTQDRKSTRLNSSHSQISYAVFCLKKKKTTKTETTSTAATTKQKT